MSTKERKLNTLKDIAYDLKTPCADCPFRSDVELHDGVARALPDMLTKLENHELMHTCHKTDDRSDGFVEGYKGELQHCAGMLIMLKNSGQLDWDSEDFNFAFAGPLARKKINPEELEDHPSVFKSFKEMCLHYKDMLMDFANRRQRQTILLDSGAVAHVSYKEDIDIPY